jgi:four helix bundle protein
MDYRELGFYQKARQTIRAVDEEIKAWPRSLQAQEISRQLFRAACSVGANISEGHGRHIGQEYIHYMIIAQGSANEVDHWLKTTIDCGIGNTDNINRILAINTEVRKMLNATIASLRQQAPRKLRESPSPYSPELFFDNEDSST